MIDRTNWLTTALTYRWPDNRWFYLSIGIGVVLQEGQQYATHADFLVWRLPVLSVQLVVSFVAMRRYRSGYYPHGRGRGRRRGKVVS
jgi:hypothetical protein